MAKGIRAHKHTLRIALAVFVAMGVLASCSDSNASDALGRQACADVTKSIATYQVAQHEANPTLATKDRVAALVELRAALRPAALAGSSNGNWQALMTTLSESSRVSEGLLISSLQAQCAAAKA